MISHHLSTVLIPDDLVLKQTLEAQKECSLDTMMYYSGISEDASPPVGCNSAAVTLCEMLIFILYIISEMKHT